MQCNLSDFGNFDWPTSSNGDHWIKKFSCPSNHLIRHVIWTDHNTWGLSCVFDHADICYSFQENPFIGALGAYRWIQSMETHGQVKTKFSMNITRIDVGNTTVVRKTNFLHKMILANLTILNRYEEGQTIHWQKEKGKRTNKIM